MYEPVAAHNHTDCQRSRWQRTACLTYFLNSHLRPLRQALLRAELGGNELATASGRTVSLRSVWGQSAVSVGSVCGQSGVSLRSVWGLLAVSLESVCGQYEQFCGPRLQRGPAE